MKQILRYRVYIHSFSLSLSLSKENNQLFVKTFNFITCHHIFIFFIKLQLTSPSFSIVIKIVNGNYRQKMNIQFKLIVYYIKHLCFFLFSSIVQK
jgi:hypothetical protein